MKFGDKLILLRKKRGFSQEELAEKLGVSRQSVSKWESNSTYPETDKIVQICNIFDCNMDDLINENITDLNVIDRKNKNNLNMAIDSFLEFIIKTINMFSDMKFSSGFKCIIELAILTMILSLFGVIFVSGFSTIISGLLPFISYINYTDSIIRSILTIVWVILSIIILVHVFKIRYLNYYDKIDNKEKSDTTDKVKKIKLEKKDRIIIRDDKNRPFEFLSILSRIIIFFTKIFVFFFGLFFAFSLLVLVACFVVSLYISFFTSIFIGSTISFLAACIVNIIILMLIIGFIFNKKYNFKAMFITFLISLVAAGLGIGLFVINIKNIDIKYDSRDLLKLNKHEEVIDYKDDMTVRNFEHNIKYVIDNELDSNKIKLVSTYDDRYIYTENHTSLEYGIKLYDVVDYEKASIEPYLIILDDLKNNIFREDYSIIYNHFDVEVHANEEVINKLMENLRKLYNYNYEKLDNKYNIYNLRYKIVDYTGDLCRYNAIKNTMDCGNLNNKCYINRIENPNGESIKLYCDDDYE